MTDSDSPIFGANRCQVKAQDEAAGIYLAVEFINDELNGPEENQHMGFFNSHEEIDLFAAHLHACLDAASGES